MTLTDEVESLVVSILLHSNKYLTVLARIYSRRAKIFSLAVMTGFSSASDEYPRCVRAFILGEHSSCACFSY